MALSLLYRFDPASRIAVRKEAPLLEMVARSEPLRRLMLARARRAGPSDAERWPQGAASRRGLEALAEDRRRTLAAAPLDLGPNATFRSALEEAAALSGLSPAALAALIDAEAAKSADGAWDPESKNPASSARGLAQFLDETWIAEARNSRRFLHREAKARDLIDDKGAPRDRAALLAMRLEPRVAIIAASELAADNLVSLARSGYAPKDDETAARLAYLAHHEGLTGARAHLEGRTPPERAERRMRANLSEERAELWLAAFDGAPNRAYAAWLEAYIERRIRPDTFESLPKG